MLPTLLFLVQKANIGSFPSPTTATWTEQGPNWHGVFEQEKMSNEEITSKVPPNKPRMAESVIQVDVKVEL